MSAKTKKHLTTLTSRKVLRIIGQPYSHTTRVSVLGWKHVRPTGRSLMRTYHRIPYHYHGVSLGVADVTCY